MLYTQADVAQFGQHTFHYIQVQVQDKFLNLTLNRPEKRNAFNPKMLEEIAFALAWAHYTPECWGVVLRAKGPVFCAGADLKAWAGDAPEPNASTVPTAPGEVLIGEEFVKVHKPCIAEVRGPVYAGGHLLVGGCHFVVATDDVFFELSEVRRGVFPMQVMATLLNIVPPRKVLQWCLTGERVSAQEAYGYGLVTHLTDRTHASSIVAKLCNTIRSGAPTAIRNGLRAFDELRHIPRQEAHAFLKAMLAETLKSEDAREGLAAFKDKRTPNWTGR
jgi:enoyl-CoA hydratase/carnithine racemase